MFSHCRGALVLTLTAAMLSGCDSINSLTAGALHYGETNSASTFSNLQRANVDAVELWKKTACALTLGGIAAVGDSTAVKAALMACPAPGVGTITVNENGNILVSMSPGQSTIAPAAAGAKP
jgi:hypothetical protein